MKVLLLGSDGFIGKALAARLASSHQVVKVNRDTNLEKLFKVNQTFDFVINCVSSKPSSDVSESNESNFEYPKRIFEGVDTKRWVQLESYFQLQISMGRQDYYTLDKQRFSDYLDTRVKTESSPSIHHLFMPHVFGEGDRPGRLISSAILAMKSGSILEASSGTQYLPILHITDAVSGIVSFLDNPTKEASCLPFWYGQVRELITIISSVCHSSRVSFGVKTDPSDANFSPVQFPSAVKDWNTGMQLNEFLEWVRCQVEES